MIYIIEPHPDDAFMSLHAHITGPWKTFDKTIVTVTCPPERAGEAASYALSVGCKHLALGFEDGNWGPSKIPQFSEWNLKTSLSDFLIFPLGLRHPDHVKVNAESPVGSLFYLDVYYVQYETNPELEKLSSKRVVSALWATESKRHYLSRFPSQAIRFVLAQPNYPPRFELVLKGSADA